MERRLAGLRQSGHSSARFESVHGLADGADPDDELGGGSGGTRALVVTDVPQELVLRGHDAVCCPEFVVELVVQARLTADQVGEERHVDRVCTLRLCCHGMNYPTTPRHEQPGQLYNRRSFRRPARC